ncbi:ABC transporter substrate-binding protein [Jeongeupia chitinilytica]|uniref:Desulfurase n=1 Tax=Jeongeupia chitinilytica TaxID=1041641 RepID=A0ABQ3H1C6_9NEIS|nr:ABC transporter substrate-binding protein [Jeongeupia chitinilytica]GHD63731.1 desulfurase [Jeongeupia chitinilytica]
MASISEPQSPVLPLSYARSPVPTPLGIAVHLGWLNGELSADGIAIRSLQSTDPSAGSSSFRTLSQSFRQGGSVPAIWARARGAATRVIGLTWVDESQLLITRPDSGITQLDALKGRRIGLPLRADDGIDLFRATALRGTLNALSLVGLDAGDIELVDIAAAPIEPRPQAPATNDYAAECAALLRGEVDAIYVKGAHGLKAVDDIGARVIADIGFHPDPRIRNNNGTPRPLTVNADVLQQHPDIVSGFLGLVADAGDWARTHPGRTLDFVSAETGIEVPWVSRAYGDRLHLHLGLGLDDAGIAALADFKSFLLEWGFLERDFDLADWIDPAPLDAVLAGRQRRLA